MEAASRYAAIPAARRGLRKNLGVSKQLANLVVPLGISLNPQGSVLQFSLAAIFSTQLYAISLSWQEYLLILFGSALAGLAASSAPGIVGLGMLSIILSPLGIPVSVVVILLAAIDPLVDPVLTLVNVHANCTATVVASRGHMEMADLESPKKAIP